MVDPLFFEFVVLVHSSAIGLGVGASTLAITGFVTALGNDGKIDVSERRMMGVIYLSLRIAMALILMASLILYWIDPLFFGWFSMPMWILIGVLYGNAFLMTKHWISSKVGPAIQAGTWYTLGFLITIFVFDLAQLSFNDFLVFYAVDLVGAILIVNGCLVYLKNKRSRKK